MASNAILFLHNLIVQKFLLRFKIFSNFLQKMTFFFKFAREIGGCKKRGRRRRRRRGTFFFIHFFLFQHNSRDSARPSASLRSEKFRASLAQAKNKWFLRLIRLWIK
jgi:hypothetical protein